MRAKRMRKLRRRKFVRLHQDQLPPDELPWLKLSGVSIDWGCAGYGNGADAVADASIRAGSATCQAA